MNQASNRTQIKDQIFQRLGQIAASLASPARLKIIQLLAQGPKSVEELSQESGESVANTSQHLQKLAKEGLVVATRDGLNRIYQVKSPRIILLWESLQDLAHELVPELNEAESKLTDLSFRSPEPLANIWSEVKRGKAILLDVRHQKEAFATPVPGSKAIPLKEIHTALNELPKKKTIYIFCRGRYCTMATEAVKLLRQKGFAAYRLRESSVRIQSQQAKDGEV
jgi:DNA-binding transcriptional ArsR family regulator/rhodanese-related sulfurtransferase